MRQYLALTAVAAFLTVNGLGAAPAHAACAADAEMAKTEVMMLPDGDSKTMALENVAMAMEKAAAKDETECMAQVTKAKMALAEHDAMAKDKMAKDAMAEPKTN